MNACIGVCFLCRMERERCTPASRHWTVGTESMDGEILHTKVSKSVLKPEQSSDWLCENPVRVKITADMDQGHKSTNMTDY